MVEAAKAIVDAEGCTLSDALAGLIAIGLQHRDGAPLPAVKSPAPTLEPGCVLVKFSDATFNALSAGARATRQPLGELVAALIDKSFTTDPVQLPAILRPKEIARRAEVMAEQVSLPSTMAPLRTAEELGAWREALANIPVCQPASFPGSRLKGAARPAPRQKAPV
jgi:hypothetical protein